MQYKRYALEMSNHVYTNHQPGRAVDRDTDKYSKPKRNKKAKTERSFHGIRDSLVKLTILSPFPILQLNLKLAWRPSTCQSTGRTTNPAIRHPSDFV
jgi:hypothetical protein